MAKKKIETQADAEAAAANLTENGGLKPPEGSLISGPSKRIQKLLESDLIAKIHKKHGANVLQLASESNARVEFRIPSEIFTLDLALGGGFLTGRVHTIYGPKGGGKTSTLLRTMGNAQKMCSNCWTYPEVFDWKTGEVYDKPKCACQKFRETVCAYIEVESTYDEKFTRRLGVDTDRLVLSTPEYAEQSLDIAEALLRSGEVDILGLDSIAFLTPSKEIEESTAKETMGVQPRVIGKGVRKFVAALNWASNHGRKPTIFFTNQIRMKLGVMFGNPETQSGGMAPGFAATTEVRVSPGKYEIEPTPKDAPAGFVPRPLYVDMNFKVEKNKGAVPKMEGAYRLILSDTETKKIGQVYDENIIVEEAERIGLIKKEGGDWTCLGQPFDTKSKIEREMLLNPMFKSRVRAALIQVINP